MYAELARHFRAAAAVGGLERAVRYGRLAAEQAKSAGAYDEAISHFEAVLRLLPAESVEVTELRVELGQVQMRKGHAFKAQDTYRATRSRRPGATAGPSRRRRPRWATRRRSTNRAHPAARLCAWCPRPSA